MFTDAMKRDRPLHGIKWVRHAQDEMWGVMLHNEFTHEDFETISILILVRLGYRVFDSNCENKLKCKHSKIVMFKLFVQHSWDIRNVLVPMGIGRSYDK